ncbi:hypothetical protein Hanom_Chr02g00159121 [Helianthus anomalus]
MKAPYLKTDDVICDDNLKSILGHQGVEVNLDQIKGLVLRHFPTYMDETFLISSDLQQFFSLKMKMVANEMSVNEAFRICCVVIKDEDIEVQQLIDIEIGCCGWEGEMQ